MSHVICLTRALFPNRFLFFSRIVYCRASAPCTYRDCFFSVILQIHAYRTETVHPYYKNGSISRILLVATLITYTHTHGYILSCVLAKIMVVHPRTIKHERRRWCWRGALAENFKFLARPRTMYHFRCTVFR